mmetsp:Transcript_68743/g.100640  ORF Transcript_68743/g.100640 Transcript_68743/m.100640 type:complete len:382 (+) Transcript_68743:210-1355(+)
MYIKYILVFVTISLVERDGPSSSSIHVYIYMYIYIYARLYVYTHIWMCMDVSMFSCNMYDSMHVHTQVNTHHPRWVSPSVQVALGIIVLLTLISAPLGCPVLNPNPILGLGFFRPSGPSFSAPGATGAANTPPAVSLEGGGGMEEDVVALRSNLATHLGLACAASASFVFADVESGALLLTALAATRSLLEALPGRELALLALPGLSCEASRSFDASRSRGVTLLSVRSRGVVLPAALVPLVLGSPVLVDFSALRTLASSLAASFTSSSRSSTSIIRSPATFKFKPTEDSYSSTAARNVIRSLGSSLLTILRTRSSFFNCSAMPRPRPRRRLGSARDSFMATSSNKMNARRSNILRIGCIESRRSLHADKCSSCNSRVSSV